MKQAEVHLYRAADYPRMPWRNGGGTTQEVACNPGGSTAAFDWRLSIADVAQDGGFSAFTGYQRIITVLEGQGIQLTVDGQEKAPLTPRRAYAFSGDAQVQCRLLGGPIRDFNLIYAPARYHARLQWVAGVDRWTFHSAASSVLVLNAGGALSVRVNGAPHALPSRYDCLHVESRGGLAEYGLEAAAPLDACVIELLPRNT
ncbi:HutD family protein [Achromobacter anxifer]|uniref:HutD/Ves family protein n=1 Tax=Achromobacter anxifer TaxID=1287737 RepID=UPI00155D267A|nr:HutD family protein [Achromobacter anxifer]MDF8365692.1 HutD family protein [Achromobacter anxifer]CAB5515373.1 Protein Ves [Achromobacter anxifer]